MGDQICMARTPGIIRYFPLTSDKLLPLRRGELLRQITASLIGSDAREGLEYHPTVKPTAMLMDALRDVTARGDIVLDPFLGYPR